MNINHCKVNIIARTPSMITNASLSLRKHRVFLNAFFFLLFAVEAHADIWGDFSYNVIDGTSVTITGYTGSGGEVSIPSRINGLPVTSIGDLAFASCDGLTGNLVIPEGITSIGWRAFSNCTGLDGTLTLPGTLKTIDAFAFDYCFRLTGNLGLPKGLTSINNGAFGLCRGFSGNLVIPEGGGAIGSDAFSLCIGLSGTLTLPGTLETIGEGAFSNCPFTGNVFIPAKLVSIGEGTFDRCNSMTGFTVHANNLAYSSAHGLLLSKDGKTVIKCPEGKTGSPVIPEGVTIIGDGAFYFCKKLTGNVLIPEGVMSIERYAFACCTGLSSLTFTGNAPASVGSYAFSYQANDFLVYFRRGAVGFSTPAWTPYSEEIPCQMIPNHAPRFRIIGNKTILAGQKITFEVIADDEDVGDALQYSATNP